ncbi:Mandelamide hydrolase [Corynebacterium ciconiae DSM 44920]|uniref:amidase family protein n=1 Tax=Corynebacterium ciconiae TaxID=227319 RepID=UPI00037FC394|nr:amidase family protein [Corynebacterium ciconiae]WKD62149.1 Mandelamide hydrolase [Corynebacterium ciconiae DSM 44920]
MADAYVKRRGPRRRTIVLTVAGVLLAGVTAAAVALWPAPEVSEISGEEVLNYHDDSVRSQALAQLAGMNLQAVRAAGEKVVNKDAPSLQQAVAAGELSYEEITAVYLERIAHIDQAEGGINSVTAINPHAMDAARAADHDRAQATYTGQIIPPLFGLSVLLKDNISTADMPTSAGTLALSEFQPAHNAPLVDALNGAGAIILGKAAMSELAGFLSASAPAGYSGKHGQTHNPFGPRTFSPLGSSTGSAVSVAASMATVSVGTETSGSIVAPAAANSVVGFTPSHGAIDADGVIPLAAALDTVGTMGRTVADAVAVHNAAVGVDKQLPTELDAQALLGRRIGIVARGDEELEAPAKDALRHAGAEVVDIELDSAGIDVAGVVESNFAADYADYAQRYDAPVTSLRELVRFNNADPQRRARYGQGFLEDAAERSPQPEATAATIDQATELLRTTLQEHQLDALVVYDNGLAELAGAAGAPQITVPYGAEDSGRPHGLSFIVSPGADAEAVSFAHAFEAAGGARLEPRAYLRDLAGGAGS